MTASPAPSRSQLYASAVNMALSYLHEARTWRRMARGSIYCDRLGEYEMAAEAEAIGCYEDARRWIKRAKRYRRNGR